MAQYLVMTQTQIANLIKKNLTSVKDDYPHNPPKNA